MRLKIEAEINCRILLLSPVWNLPVSICNIPNFNSYVFPPFSMIGPIAKFLFGFCVPFIILVPETNPTSYWWRWLIGSKNLCRL